MIQQILAIFIGKLLFILTRIFKFGGGSAAPGLYASKIDPNLVSQLSKQIPVNVVVTGTNGKTTTSKLLTHFARKSGLNVLGNSTGSNLERGIASALISCSHIGSLDRERSRIGGRLDKIDLGIWELDEAAFNQVAPKLNPKVVVFLNAFRDQLDRYGEVDSVVKKWQATLQKLPKNTEVILNGDDGNLWKLKNSISGKITTFGIKEGKIQGESSLNIKDMAWLAVEARNIETTSLEQTSFDVFDKAVEHHINLPLPGIYNVYNFLAAFTASQKLGIEPKNTIPSLSDFSSAFGRVEKITLASGNQAFIFLIKNPTGATQVLNTIKDQLTPDDSLLIALNDNLADGTDVSWIWDVEFEKLKIKNLKFKIFCSGSRAYDLALRLKYAGIEPELLTVQPNLKNALQDAQKGLKGRLFILPTYTALLSLQHILTSGGLKTHYWKEKL